jgi:serine-type D-Ala-D-Ala carboxypeptidase/endopeptidase (penicillin-binding protein 4)
LRNEITTGPVGSGDQACIYGSEGSHVRFLRGTIPAAVAAFSIKGSIADPSDYLAALFAKMLEKSGISIAGCILEQGQRLAFHTTESPTVAEIVHATNQRSQNLYAEHLLKAMGDGVTKAGIAKVKEFWQSQGIDLTDFHMTDGSGLSRSNVISAKQAVAMMRKMTTSSHFPTFLKSLPEINGMKVKSGSMALITGYVGYCGDVVFAFFIGQCPDFKKKKALTAACFEKISHLHNP